MMPAMLSTNSMATTGKGARWRLERTVSQDPVEEVALVALEQVVVDSAVDRVVDSVEVVEASLGAVAATWTIVVVEALEEALVEVVDLLPTLGTITLEELPYPPTSSPTMLLVEATAVPSSMSAMLVQAHSLC